jgi:hypothetical protein
METAQAELPKTTPEQDAWVLLIQLEVGIRNLEDALASEKKVELFYRRAVFLHDKYIETRDAELDSLYGSIESRFIQLYSYMHRPDEPNFSAELRPKEAALNLEVDFYGRGKQPPNAMHSEGHQDSMGICLWLALSEHLTQGVIDLLILDDVVMSVDVDHRRQICELLINEFNDKQFFIATHDRNWVSMLNYSSLVRAKRTYELYNWKIDSGPLLNDQTEIWTGVENDIQRGDIPSAAQKLRRGSEDYFRIVCDALAAKVVFKESMKWELGDTMPSAYSRLGELMAEGKKAANSWGQKDIVDMIDEWDSCRKTIFGRTKAEYWMINESVHYNNWGDLSPSDFKPVVEAFHDLFDLFRCSKCEGMLRISYQNKTPKEVRCSCGEFGWNLIVKK